MLTTSVGGVGGVEDGLSIVAADVLALRGAGLEAAETWALLCQAAQALQDLFLSNGGVVGGSRAGPVVTPNTIELTPRGRVTLLQAPPETARAYLPPEYRPGRVYSDTDSEKMWMYSLGRALLDTTPRATALTGTVSVSPSCALQSVLAATTEPDPRRRASLMNLLDVISEYCRSRLQSRPFTHIVMDMYREVIRSPQYAARKRALLRTANKNLSTAVVHQRHPRQYTTSTQRWSGGHRFSKHNPKADGALFRIQSRNSRSHPNLLGLSADHESPLPRFQSQLDMINAADRLDPPSIAFSHSRTGSQPLTIASQIRSNGDLMERQIAINLREQYQYQRHQRNGVLEMPPPLKPFLSSQDVRVLGGNELMKMGQDQEQYFAKPTNVRRNNLACFSSSSSSTSSSRTNGIQQKESTYEPLVSLPKEEIYAIAESSRNARFGTTLQKQLPIHRLRNSNQESNNETSNPSIPKRMTDNFRTCIGNSSGQQRIQEYHRNPVSSGNISDIYGSVMPKNPQTITSVKRVASSTQISDAENGIPKKSDQRIVAKNGLRARRGKPVQRAPSRLYRAIGGQMRNFNKTQCVGPEFVIRANQPSKIMTVGDIKSGNSNRLVVIMLTGQRLEVTCDPQKITAGELFQAIVQADGLDENFTLGLAALLAGDFALLPPDTKLNKVAPPGWLNSGKSKGLLGLPASFMLYLRLRFFLPSLRGIRSWTSKHLLYLQIRRCILEQQLVCPLTQLINLTGLALQAEFGNYSVNEHGCGDYFLLEHYIPESLILNPDQDQQYSDLPSNTENLKRQLHQAHRDRRGLDANRAEEMFITHAQTLTDYGSHYYIATADAKELSKVISRQRISEKRISPVGKICPEDIYAKLKRDCPVPGRTEIYEKKIILSRNSGVNEDIYSSVKNGKGSVEAVNDYSKNGNTSKSKKTESSVWLAIHGEGLKLFERGGGRFRERKELARFQWKDIQTLSYSKSYLVIFTKVNGKRCKFKLKMDHRKSYFAFKLTSLHHQFFLKLRSEMSSLQGLAKDFGVPLIIEPNSPKAKPESGKTKISIADAIKKQSELQSKYPLQLEEYQNKENENPQKDSGNWNSNQVTTPPICCSSPEEDALYAQVNARMEPEGESRDTEEESDRDGTSMRNRAISRILNGQKILSSIEDQIYGYANVGRAHDEEYVYCIPKLTYTSDIERLKVKSEKPIEDIYAAVNKTGLKKKNQLPVPEEVWDVDDIKRSMSKVKTSSLPNYGTPKLRQASGFRTPSLPRRLGVKMGTRAIYSSSNLVQRDSSLADDLESLSLKSDTVSSMQSTPARSVESPMPEAYVLNADIRLANETFRIPNEETMSPSLMARLEEISFAEERILHVIKLERGNGGSIGLQVTEGNDGGVYVQAVSVGGSADMAGNVNKGDRVVAINGQSLMNLSYEDALKLLQSSSETVELVLSQVASQKNRNMKQSEQCLPNSNNYLQNIRFNISSETDTWNMATKWLNNDGSSERKNTWNSYSSSTSTATEKNNLNSTYTISKGIDPHDLHSASMMLSLEDFDVSRSNDEIDPQSPPIPPRRKRKKKNLSAIVASEPTSKSSSKPRRKPRLPPPPPPPVQKAREKRSQFVNNPHHMKEPESDFENNSTTETKSIPFKIKFNIGEEDRDSKVRPNFQNLNENRFQNRNVYTYPPQHREPNRYPPLLFTYQDFQSVMAESITNRDYQTSLDETFSSNNLMDESKVCFRVTTTNLPFEKCLGKWQNSFDNPEFVASDESSFIFEDYIDRSNRPARPDLFRMESLENSVEDIVPNRTKVRFVIESPSTSTPDEDADITMDSLQNIESLNKDLEELQKIQSICEAIQNSERDLSLDSFLCDSDALNLVEVISEIDFICENVVESEETEDNKVMDKEKIDKEKTDDAEKIEDEEKDYPDVSKVDIESSSNEVIEKAHPEKEVQKILANTKLQRFKTYVSADQCTTDISESEKPEENLEESKEVSHSSKLQRYKTQKSGSGSYEDAFDSEELILNKSSEVSEDKVMGTSEHPDNQNINIENQEGKAGEESSKKKIFIDSSLCDFINDDNEVKWNASSDEEKKISFINLESEIKIDPRPQVSSIPVSVRRNSFLDKMLNVETCEVLAIHPKPDDSIPEKGMRPALELESPSQEFPALSTSSERKVARSSKFGESRNKVQKGKILEEGKVVKKSFGEAKCEVLNELLCNFSAIKLKSVPNSKTVDRDPSANHVKLPDESVCEQKTDQLRVEEGGSASARATDPSEALASVEDQLINVDKCAIARRSPKTYNNNIDNNAKTPVALSNDQPQDAFSITPGSVRNFIKHYEIQQETSNQCFKDKEVRDKYVKATDDKAKDDTDKDNKAKENDTKDLSSYKDLSSKEEIETLELEEEADQDSLMDLTNLENNESIGRCKPSNFIENSKQEFESSCQSLTTNGTKGKKQSCIKSNDSSPISERKKSVQFDSACTVIHLQKQEESTMTSLINGIRYRIKGKAPNKPEVQMPITFKTLLRPDDSTPDIKNESEAQSTGNSSKPGTDLVPKTENPQQNQTFVFYCKV